MKSSDAPFSGQDTGTTDKSVETVQRELENCFLLSGKNICSIRCTNHERSMFYTNRMSSDDSSKSCLTKHVVSYICCDKHI